MQQEKTGARMLPNERLRLERQRRGWSRMYIAEQIGVADPKTVGRWERGDAFPSAYFLQRLCALFEMAAEELGLWRPESLHTPVEGAPVYFSYHTRFQSLSATSLRDPALPPAHVEDLLGRARLRSQVKRRLEDGGASAVAALSGLPGVGKTALAVSLAHDSDLQRAFSDGVLWANLGPDADVLEELKRWGRLLEIDESEPGHPESIADWTRAIHAHLDARAMLLVIDDAWTCQDALAFKIGGSNCAYLLTTRIPAVALYFAGAGASSVHPLCEEESLRMLARFVPELVALEGESLRELAREVDGLPLALELLGAHLQIQVCSGQSRRWRAALERLMQPAERLQLTLPRAPLERPTGLPADTPISLQSTIELSYRQLEPATQQALIALAGLLPREEDFAEEDALAINGVSLEVLDNLLDAGLLASASQGRYTLHQTIRDFASFQEEQARSIASMPPQVRMLRQLRGKGTRGPEHTSHTAHAREDVLPALVQGSGEVVTLSSS